MSWLWFLVIALLLLLGYLLFAPFYLEVDSRSGLFRIRFHKVASVRIFLADGSLFLETHLPGWHKTMDLFAPGKIRKVEKGVRPVKKKKKLSLGKIFAVVRSFKVNKFSVRLDTGNMPLNGILYPFFLWLGRWMNRDMEINFMNENEVVIEIENSVFRMIRVYITS